MAERGRREGNQQGAEGEVVLEVLVERSTSWQCIVRKGRPTQLCFRILLRGRVALVPLGR